MALAVRFPLTKKYIAEVLSQGIGLDIPGFTHHSPFSRFGREVSNGSVVADLAFSQYTGETRMRGETLVASSGYPVSVMRPSFSRCRLAWARLTLFRTKSSRAIPAW